MHRLTAMGCQRLPKPLAGGAKCNSIDDRAVGRAQANTHVGLADLFHVDERVCRQHNNRLWIARPEQTSASYNLSLITVAPGRRDLAINEDCVITARSLYRGSKVCFEKGAETRKSILVQRDSGCHGVAASLHDHPLPDRLAHSTAEIDTRD